MADATAQPIETFEQHRPALLQWAEAQAPAWIRAKVDPGDLVQQTLLEAIKDQTRLAARSDHEVLAYLRRALTHNLIDAARKYARNRHDVSPDAFAASSVRMADWLAADQSSPSEQAVRNERYASLAVSLTRLPDDQRMAIEMRYLQAATVRDIAIVLERSEGAVSALLHRAVLALRGDRNIHETQLG